MVEVYPVTQTENPVHFENLSMRKHDDLPSVGVAQLSPRTAEVEEKTQRNMHRDDPTIIIERDSKLLCSM